MVVSSLHDTTTSQHNTTHDCLLRVFSLSTDFGHDVSLFTPGENDFDSFTIRLDETRFCSINFSSMMHDRQRSPFSTQQFQIPQNTKGLCVDLTFTTWWKKGLHVLEAYYDWYHSKLSRSGTQACFSRTTKVLLLLQQQ